MTPSEREHRPRRFVRVNFFPRATTTTATAALAATTTFISLRGLVGVRHGLGLLRCARRLAAVAVSARVSSVGSDQV